MLSQLAAIAGEANVSGDAGELRRYSIDGRKPAAVARPSSAAEIAELLRFCAAGKLAAVPAGAGTKLRIGAPPARYDLALATTRLNRVLAYDPADLTLGVEAGAPLAGIQELLAQHRQFLPLAVPYAKQTTIGGTIASGIDSPLRHRYGTARDFLLGMEFVTGDGTAARAGGRVVKNVAGYDLHKVLIGSLGTLAVITRLNFKTFPLPESSRVFLAAFAHPADALELAARLRRSKLEPATADLVSPELAQLLVQAAPGIDPGMPAPGAGFGAGQWVMAVGYGGSGAVLKRVEDELAKMAGEAGCTGRQVFRDGERPAAWGRLREAIPLVLERSPMAVIGKGSVLPARMKPLLAATQEIAERHKLKPAVLARAAGVVYAAFLPEPAGENILESLASASTAWLEAAAAAEGFAWIPWCPAELKSRVAVWGGERDERGLMRKLKQQFDPQGVLSPGRFVGGI